MARSDTAPVVRGSTKLRVPGAKVALAFAAVLGLTVIGLRGNTSGAQTAAAPSPGSIVDGFPLGARLLEAPDSSLLDLARRALDERNPQHQAIASEVAYHEDLSLVYGNDAGRSGTMTVFVFLLADGSYHASGVYCGVGACESWPYYTGQP